MKPLRHRDLLISLKYSIIEACFSVPMLNLTMPNFPFVIAFAVSALGWGPAGVGLMAALPHLCNFVQPPLTTLLRRMFSLHQIMRLSFVLSAAPWACMALLPWIEAARRDAVFAAVLLVATLANSVGSVAWSASIAEVVPARVSGLFFARRNLMFGFWTLVVVLAAGELVDLGRSSLLVFGYVFAAAGAARLMGLFFLHRMRFPASVMRPDPAAARWREFLRALRDRNYLRLVVFVGMWGLLLNMSLPFYTVFLLERLGFGVADVIWLTTVASLGGLVTVRGWGLLCDRFGTKPVMVVCSLAWAVVALVSWVLAGPRWHAHLWATYFFVGGTTTGFQLCQFNLMLKLAPAQKAPSVAVFLSLTSLLTAVGPALGGAALRWMDDDLGRFFGQPLRDYHLLFGISLLGCLLATHLLNPVREEAAQPAETVWRTMRTMRAFNPMLMIATAAELLLTPRGLVAMTRRSLRTLRRQARAITEVGEIVSGGRDALRSPFDRRK